MHECVFASAGVLTSGDAGRALSWLHVMPPAHPCYNAQPGSALPPPASLRHCRSKATHGIRSPGIRSARMLCRSSCRSRLAPSRSCAPKRCR